MSNSAIVTQTVTPPGTDLDAELLAGVGPGGADLYRERVQVSGATLAEIATVKQIAPGAIYGLVVAAGYDGTLPEGLCTQGNGLLFTMTTESIAIATTSGRVPGTGGNARGTVTTTATTEVAVNQAPVYVEQTTGAQRSIVSTSANDTSAGTGARTVRIIYYVQTGTGTVTGPNTEDIPLNGTTAVNTVATNIRYIEKMFVLTAGSGGVNAGQINLFTGTAGAGSIFAGIAASARTSGYAHHYIQSGFNCYLMNAIITSTSTTSNSPSFMIRSLDLSTSNAAERVVFDQLTAEGSVNSESLPLSAVQINGPARFQVYVTPTNATSQVNSASVTYAEI